MNKAARQASYGQVNRRGVFISFEGVDGCGKSTQIKELRRRFISLNREPIVTREPGGTLLGEDIRRILQHSGEAVRISAESELLLFAASRAQLVIEVVEPALASGRHVIADRFLDSTTIYQGVARGLEAETVERINRFAVGDCRPDITFLIDADPQIARNRVNARPGSAHGDRIEKLPETFFSQVRRGYLELASTECDRFVVIDGEQKIGSISDRIWNTLTTRFDGFPA